MVNQGYEIIELLDIMYLERLHRKVGIHLKNGTVVTVNDTLKNLGHIFSERNLFPCHKSFLVPLDSIESVRMEKQGNAGYLLLRGCSEQIPLSRKAYSELKKAMETNGLTFR